MTADRPGRWVLEPSEPNAPPTLRFVADGDTPPDPNVIRIGSAGITLGVVPDRAEERDVRPTLAEDEKQRYVKWLRAMVDARTFEGHAWVLSVDAAMKAGMAMADREARIEDGLTVPISWDEWEATHEALIAAQAERCPDPTRHDQQIGNGSKRWYVVPEDEYDRLKGADAEPFGRVTVDGVDLTVERVIEPNGARGLIVQPVQPVDAPVAKP